MTIQYIAVVGLVIAAALYLLRATYRTWFGSVSGCGNGCGKCSTTTETQVASGRKSLPMA